MQIDQLQVFDTIKGDFDLSKFNKISRYLIVLD